MGGRMIVAFAAVLLSVKCITALLVMVALAALLLPRKDINVPSILAIAAGLLLTNVILPFPVIVAFAAVLLAAKCTPGPARMSISVAALLAIVALAAVLLPPKAREPPGPSKNVGEKAEPFTMPVPIIDKAIDGER